MVHEWHTMLWLLHLSRNNRFAKNLWYDNAGQPTAAPTSLPPTATLDYYS